MQLIGIFGMRQTNHKDLPLPLPRLQSLFEVFNEVASASIWLLQDIERLDSIQMAFLQCTHHFGSRQTQRGKVVIPERPAVRFPLDKNEGTGLSGFWQLFES